MIRIYERMKEEKFSSMMILQVHDELIFEVLNSELESLRELVLFEMSNAVRLDIPLKVDCGTGKSWFEAH
jgi:DNA polymerase-1